MTIVAPCILPMLPVILGASVGRHGKWRPVFIVAGFAVSFTLAALLLSFMVHSLGAAPDLLRDLAVSLLAIFGLLMIWPKPLEALSFRLPKIARPFSGYGDNLNGFGIGLLLGLIWTPCAGPVLGSILVLAATQGSTAKAAILLLAYSFGVGLPMLAVAYGSQWITAQTQRLARYSRWMQQAGGVIILAVALAIYFKWDIQVENSLQNYCPAANGGITQGLPGLNGGYTAVSPPFGQQPAPMAPSQQFPYTDYGPASR